MPNSLPSWNESLNFCEWKGVKCGHRHESHCLAFGNEDWGGTLGRSLGKSNLPQKPQSFKHQLAWSNSNTSWSFEAVTGNHFTGAFPSSISNITELEGFDISSNGFSAPIPPTLGSLYKLERFHIAYNNFGSGRAHDLDFLSSLINCTQLQKLILDGNGFGVTMGFNQISGVIPEGIGQLIGLTEFDMTENFLEGTIPDSIGKLKNLGRLTLQENKLSGNIPAVIGNLTMLSELHLLSNEFEGSIPFTLRYCTQLQTIGVSGNNLSGDIPIQTFGHLKDLINLDLSNNTLTGSIPLEFGELKHLSILYLFENKLSGEIPKELVACLALTELVLERNFFYGSIPSFLGSLSSLELLDLSYNNFSSTIPPELENLTLLDSLDLSFNQLYGEVPRGVFISIYYLKKKPKELSSLPSLQNRYLKVSYGELHEATNGFSSSNLVGTGGFGSVYRGSLLNFERPIAVKVLNLATRGASKSFTAECKALGQIKHRNLLNILTCCSSVDYNGEDFKAIVYEHWIIFTHDSEEGVVHCDIKPSNVLLDDDIVAHLGDFGLARLLHVTMGHSSRDQVSSSAIKGTIGYVPPEYGAGGPVTPQGDIYSYGILLLEMLTRKKPTDNLFGEGLSLHKFCMMAIPEGITEIVDPRLLVPFAEEHIGVVEDNIRECLVSFARIGVACSEDFPAERMHIKDVIVELHAIKQKLPL
ncbi:Serine-threonine/tyrosine-protein kinase, catalytic domain [Sesbania bispinosa]|nr:Serine-threonine/tyrosine-protein kinase, catalytic domain [Sesbania bispinosa]